MVAPTLSANFSFVLPSILESAANTDGVLISALLTNGAITDPDGVVEGLALTALDTSMGAWQFSLDGGANWLTIDAQSINSAANQLSLLLGPMAKLRLVPFGDINGTLQTAITFRAWDMSDALLSGTYKIITNTGANTAYSSVSSTASLTLTPVNDAPTFIRGSGIQYVPVLSEGFGNDYASKTILQPDGKILVGGYSAYNNLETVFSIARLNADGSFDTGFDGDGKITVSAGVAAHGYDMALQADGKILIAGQRSDGGNEDFAVVRVNPNGTIDTGFGNQGRVFIDLSGSADFGNSVAIQADGKIILAGVVFGEQRYSLAVVRLNANGSLDSSFSGDGKVIAPFTTIGVDIVQDVIVQPDGKILVVGEGGGQGLALARFNSDGNLDFSFGAGGKAIVPSLGRGESLLLLQDGKILVAGYSQTPGASELFVARLTASGSLDVGFGQAGIARFDSPGSTSDTLHAITLQEDGKILVVGESHNGNFNSLHVFRLLPSGALDLGFSAGGRYVLPLETYGDYSYGYSVLEDPSGKILLSGYGQKFPESESIDFLMVRLNADGSLDNRFNIGLPNNSLGDVVSSPVSASPTPIDTHIEIYDPELAALNNGLGNYGGSSVILARAGGANSEDIFSPLGNLSFNGGDLLLSGVNVGAVSLFDGTLTMDFNNNATQSRINEVLSSIGYSTANPTQWGTAEINWLFSDGNSVAQGLGGELSVMGRTTVGVNWVNDPGIMWISGVAIEGQTLRAVLVDSDLPDVNTIVYQWYKNNEAIPNANSAIYTLSEDDIGDRITVNAFAILNIYGDTELLAESDEKTVFASMTEVQRDLLEMYVIILDRAPAPDGLQFWNDLVVNGYSFEYVANEMWESPGAKSFYPRTFTTEQMVVNVYNNILNRDPAESGKAFWIQQWDNSGPTATMLEMIDALTANNSSNPQALADKQLFQDKINVGGYLSLTRESDDITLAYSAYDYLNQGHTFDETISYIDAQLGVIGLSTGHAEMLVI